MLSLTAAEADSPQAKKGRLQVLPNDVIGPDCTSFCQEYGEDNVRMWLLPRMYGRYFSPVSIAASGDRLWLHVRNTPWGEYHTYCFDCDPDDKGWRHGVTRKTFHVSPFLDMDFEYRVKWKISADDLHVSIADWRDHKRYFEAVLNLKRTDLPVRSLLWRAWWLPAVSFLRIYSHGLRLKIGGARYYPHPQFICTRADNLALAYPNRNVI